MTMVGGDLLFSVFLLLPSAISARRLREDTRRAPPRARRLVTNVMNVSLVGPSPTLKVDMLLVPFRRASALKHMLLCCMQVLSMC